MARGEITELEPAIEQMEEQIKLLLIPKDPQDSKNAIMEIRGGTGGDEGGHLRRRPAAHVHQIHRVEGLAL